MFCTQIQKIPIFEPMLDYITLRKFGTVRPIFWKIASKLRKTRKKKVAKARCAGKNSAKLSREMSRGGGVDSTPRSF